MVFLHVKWISFSLWWQQANLSQKGKTIERKWVNRDNKQQETQRQNWTLSTDLKMMQMLWCRLERRWWLAEANSPVQAVAGGGVLTSGAVMSGSSPVPSLPSTCHHTSSIIINPDILIVTTLQHGDVEVKLTVSKGFVGLWSVNTCTEMIYLQHICYLWSAELSAKWQCNVNCNAMPFSHLGMIFRTKW